MDHATPSSAFVHKHKNVKTIGLNDDAYQRLALLKQPGESFSDVVMRITGSHWLEQFIGILDPDEAERLRQITQESRKRADRDAERRTRGLFP